MLAGLHSSQWREINTCRSSPVPRSECLTGIQWKLHGCLILTGKPCYLLLGSGPWAHDWRGHTAGCSAMGLWDVMGPVLWEFPLMGRAALWDHDDKRRFCFRTWLYGLPACGLQLIIRHELVYCLVQNRITYHLEPFWAPGKCETRPTSNHVRKLAQWFVLTKERMVVFCHATSCMQVMQLLTWLQCTRKDLSGKTKQLDAVSTYVRSETSWPWENFLQQILSRISKFFRSFQLPRCAQLCRWGFQQAIPPQPHPRCLWRGPEALVMYLVMSRFTTWPEVGMLDWGVPSTVAYQWHASDTQVTRRQPILKWPFQGLSDLFRVLSDLVSSHLETPVTRKWHAETRRNHEISQAKRSLKDSWNEVTYAWLIL